MLRDYKNMSITARLIAIAIIPVLLLSVITIVGVRFDSQSSMLRECDARGKLLSDALASSSEYAAISGNTSALRTVVRKVMHADPNVSAVEVTDKNGRTLLRETNVQTYNYGLTPRNYSTDITREVVDVDSLDETGLPHISSGLNGNGVRAPHDRVVGRLMITIVPATIAETQKVRSSLAFLSLAVSLIVTVTFGLILATSLTNPLVKVITALNEIGRGNYDVVIPINNGGEIGMLQRSANDMAISLYAYKNEMEAKVANRTRSLAAAKEQAEKSNEEKRKLIQKVNTAVEEERASMALEIHDHLNAKLIAIRLNSQRIVSLAARADKNPKVLEDIRATAQEAADHTQEMYEMARDIVKRLRPEIIDTLGLRDAIDEMVTHYDARSDYCSFSFSAEGEFDGIDSALAITAYRVVQESLSNIVKHAHATTVKVELKVNETRDVLNAVVSDNGVGFDVDTASPGIGLVGMRERAHGAGGTISFKVLPGCGTSVEISLPLNPP